jgi:hypothetical protein
MHDLEQTPSTAQMPQHTHETLHPYEVGRRAAKKLATHVNTHGADFYLKLRDDEAAARQERTWPYKRYEIVRLDAEDAHLVFHCFTNEEYDPRFIRDGVFYPDEWAEATGYTEETSIRSFCLLNVHEATFSLSLVRF